MTVMTLLPLLSLAAQVASAGLLLWLVQIARELLLVLNEDLADVPISGSPQPPPSASTQQPVRRRRRRGMPGVTTSQTLVAFAPDPWDESPGVTPPGNRLDGLET